MNKKNTVKQNTIILVLFGFVLIFLAGTANATLMFNLGGCDFSADSGGTGSCGGSGADLADDVLKMTFEDNGANTVRLTIDASNMPNTTAKISDVWFNVNSTLNYSDLTSFNYVDLDSPGDPDVAASGISAGGNVDGAGIFDIHFSYGVSGSLGDFYYGKRSVYDITGPGLTETNFDDVSTLSIQAIFHLNTTGNGNSGHYVFTGYGNGDGGNGGDGGYDGNGTAPVPEPATMLLFGTGLAGLAGTRVRRKKK